MSSQLQEFTQTPQQYKKNNKRKTGKHINKKTIVTRPCCALLAPLAFAQTGTKQGTATTEPITVTGTIIKMTTEEGSAANYQPAKTLVVREDRSNTPGSY